MAEKESVFISSSLHIRVTTSVTRINSDSGLYIVRHRAVYFWSNVDVKIIVKYENIEERSIVTDSVQLLIYLTVAAAFVVRNILFTHL